MKKINSPPVKPNRDKGHFRREFDFFTELKIHSLLINVNELWLILLFSNILNEEQRGALNKLPSNGNNTLCCH
jgi:hypothetical protein